MRVPPDHILRLTHALTRDEDAALAAEALADRREREVLEGLVELLSRPHSSRAGTAAVRALEAHPEPIAVDALLAAAESPHTPVRVAAVQSLHRRRALRADETLAARLRLDPAWIVRRAALNALADFPDERRWRVLLASDDPHWRMRHALIQVLLRWNRDEVERRLSEPDSPRVEGLKRYLRFRWTGAAAELASPEEPLHAQPFWDWDAAVLVRNLERMNKEGRRQALGWMPALLGHADERVRRWAVDTLRGHGEAEHLADAMRWRDDPRAGVLESLDKLTAGLNLDRIEEASRLLLHDPGSLPGALAWAIDQAGEEGFPVAEEEGRLRQFLTTPQPTVVRAALARLAGRWPDAQLVRWLLDRLSDEPEVQCAALRALGRSADRLRGTPGADTPGSPDLLDTERLRPMLQSPSAAVRREAVVLAVRSWPRDELLALMGDEPDATVRVALALPDDPHPHVRAAALTAERAQQLMDDPRRESSWHVLIQAARLLRVPAWLVEPETPWKPEPPVRSSLGSLHPARTLHPRARPLGPGGPLVAPLGISGHYGLPVEGFVHAVEAGVNQLFWEPNYVTLTEFCQRLVPSERNGLHVVMGTFEADGVKIRRDVERALTALKVDRIGLFLVFWVQSWKRFVPDVRAALEALKAEGKVLQYGLSTHNRPLALQAMDEGWNPIMVRHSAAHRGAEQAIFPRALERGTTLLTFNNTCYGRLLEPQGDLPAVRPSDCYRYTLEQPAVTMCWTAPATMEELAENLDVLRDPTMPEERRRLLLAAGECVYREDTVFRRLVRGL